MFLQAVLVQATNLETLVSLRMLDYYLDLVELHATVPAYNYSQTFPKRAKLLFTPSHLTKPQNFGKFYQMSKNLKLKKTWKLRLLL